MSVEPVENEEVDDSSEFVVRKLNALLQGKEVKSDFPGDVGVYESSLGFVSPFSILLDSELTDCTVGTDAIVAIKRRLLTRLGSNTFSRRAITDYLPIPSSASLPAPPLLLPLSPHLLLHPLCNSPYRLSTPHAPPRRANKRPQTNPRTSRIKSWRYLC